MESNDSINTNTTQLLQGIRLPTIRRFPRYLRTLRELKAQGEENVSSDYLARILKTEPIVVRKDMAFTGITGKPRIGFNISELIEAIEKLINFQNHSNAFLVGAGSLGAALLGYQGFEDHGLNILAAFDTDPQKIGTEIHEKSVLSLEKLKSLVQRMNVHIGILAVPKEVAQGVADLMIDAGIRGIWNFTPAELKVPANVVVQREDMASGLAVLAVNLERMMNEES